MISGAPPKATNSLVADARRSLSMAAKLGVSLVGTWAIALGVRIALPRSLGPIGFGNFQFADAFTTTVFIFSTLGLDTYIRKEVAVRAEHASEFFGGTLMVSLALSGVLMIAALVGLRLAGRADAVLILVLLLGIAQILFNANGLLVAILHARGTVSELALINVLAKVLWGGGIFAALYLGYGVLGAGVAVLGAESSRAVALSALVHRRGLVHLRLDRAQSLLALRGSLPYYVSGMAQTIYARIDLSIMSFLAPEREVGWYGAASTLGGLSLMLSPVIGWVMLPLTGRAAARSMDELMLLTRRANEFVLSVAFPTTLALFLFAKELVALAFGQEYTPSVQALRILAPAFVLTYANMIYASVLVRLDRGWAVTVVSLGGVIISPVLNLLLVPHGLARFGHGGAGIAAATSLIIVEAYNLVAFLLLLGRPSYDRRLLRMLVITVLACIATFGVDRLASSLGVARVLPDLLTYFAIVGGSGALEVRGAMAILRSRRSASAASRDDGEARSNT